jgi:hypothetical protein
MEGNARAWWRKYPSALLCAAIVACAGSRSGLREPAWEIWIVTDPPNARCSANFHGRAIATLGSTPGPIQVDSALSPLEITCELAGHLEYRETLGVAFLQEFEGVKYAKGVSVVPPPPSAAKSLVSLGLGIIGLNPFMVAYSVTDLATPAHGGEPTYDFATSYRSPVLVLTPATFPSETTRDEYFRGRRSSLEESAAAARARVNAACRSTNCTQDLAQVDKLLMDRLEALDAQRDVVRIVNN